MDHETRKRQLEAERCLRERFPEIADAVVFDRDPLDPGAFSAPGSVIAVIIGGELIDLTETNASS